MNLGVVVFMGDHGDKFLRRTTTSAAVNPRLDEYGEEESSSTSSVAAAISAKRQPLKSRWQGWKHRHQSKLNYGDLERGGGNSGLHSRGGSSRSSSTSDWISTSMSDPSLLYMSSSRNCPCRHHRLQRIRDSHPIWESSCDSPSSTSSLQSTSAKPGQDKTRYILDSAGESVVNSSGNNTRSNGSNRSSSRSTQFRIESDEEEDGDVVDYVTTTVILEGCDNNQQDEQRRPHDVRTTIDSPKISPECDPANNWTLKPVLGYSTATPTSTSTTVDAIPTITITPPGVANTAVRSRNPSISGSHKSTSNNGCTCVIPEHVLLPPTQPPLTVSTYPRCHKNPRRKHVNNSKPQFGVDFRQQRRYSRHRHPLAHLPTVPSALDEVEWFETPQPPRSNNQGFVEKKRRRSTPIMPSNVMWRSNTNTNLHHTHSFPPYSPHSRATGLFSSANNKRRPPPAEAIYEEQIPPCLQNIIMQQLQQPAPIQDPKIMKRLSKCIILPDDPHDPTAFTVANDQYLIQKSRPRGCGSKPVVKIVGTFSLLMTIGIVVTVFYFYYWSDTFKPMM